MEQKKRVLICANPDLNYIDGSSIWSQTIALATAASGIAKVDFLAKSKPERDELFGPVLNAPNLNVIDGSDKKHWNGKSYRRLTLPMMAKLAVTLDAANHYDVIIVRGFEIATTLLNEATVLGKTWMYLTDIPQSIEQYSQEERQQMQQVAQGCARLLCQTQGFIELWKTLVPDVPGNKISLYTPVIPDLLSNLTPIIERQKRAVYAGKFKSEWKTLEMAEAWPDVHKLVLNSQFVMIGDKIHNEPGPQNYQQRMRQALESTPGLNWLGAQSRERVQHELQQARVGLSWRAENMNDTVEYSTKILEYGGAGCAAILNRNPLHETLLGNDYPLYANSEQEFQSQLHKALTNEATTQQAADRLKELAERHTFSTRVGEIRQWLAETVGNNQQTSLVTQKTRVLVAGHDLKFFNLLQKKLETSGQFEFLVDQWQGHAKHDEAKSRELLDQADVIFCEWCLGNLKWYSYNKRPHQRLVARFHAQETRTPYMAEANWDAINHVIFVSEHTRHQALELLKGFPKDRTSIIPNYLDSNKFNPKKKTGDARFTLGMIGVAPKSKRLDRAIDLLELLLERDNCYCLRVKGKNPLDYSWLLKQEDELEYYISLYRRINSDSKLRHKVIFDPPGDNVNEWFTMVGFILSPSDFESFHMAIGEGMLTGTIPIIWDWEGADEIWPAENVIKSTENARDLLVRANQINALNDARFIEKHYSPHDVLSKWKKAFWK